MYSILVGYISISLILWWKLVICQGQIQSSVRITNSVNCNITGLKMLVDHSYTYYRYPKTYVEARYHLTEDIKKLNKLYIHIERCNDQGYDCEDFQNYRIDRLCQMFRLKNQAWSEYMSHFQPPLRCPIKKAIYEVRNATMDIDALVNWFPELTKYLWKTTFKLTNEQDEIVFCGNFDTQVYQFRLQDRKPPRKPRTDKRNENGY